MHFKTSEMQSTLYVRCMQILRKVCIALTLSGYQMEGWYEP